MGRTIHFERVMPGGAAAERRARAMRAAADGEDVGRLGDPPALEKSALFEWLNRDPPRPHRIPVHAESDAKAILARVLAEPQRPIGRSSTEQAEKCEARRKRRTALSSETRMSRWARRAALASEVCREMAVPPAPLALPEPDKLAEMADLPKLPTPPTPSAAPEKWTERPNYERDRKRRWRAARAADEETHRLDCAAHVKRQQAYRQRLKAKAQDEADARRREAMTALAEGSPR